MSRRAGVLIPLFSIRAGDKSWGLGEIPDLVAFAGWAARAGFQVAQILPVNEPSGGQASPYAARIAFAIDPVYLSLEALDDFQRAGGTGALPEELQGRLDAARASEQIRWEDVMCMRGLMGRRSFASSATRRSRSSAPRMTSSMRAMVSSMTPP